MKKIYKIMVFVMMLALAIGSVIAAPITIFAAGTALVGATIVLTKMPTKGTVNTEIVIPKGTTTTSGSNVSVKVIDPLGKEVTLLDDGDNYKFTATMVGNYKATYSASEVAGVNSKTEEVFLIKVEGSTISMNLSENSPFMLPSKVGKDTTLVLPYPNVVIGNEEYAGHYTGEVPTDDANITVKVTDPKHQVWDENTSIDNFTSPLSTKVVDDKTYYTFKATKNNDETVYGTYSIVYKYKSSSTGEVSTKSFKVYVASNYSVENQKVTFTWNGSLPESAVLGNEVTLPTPVTVDANNNSASVDTYSKVSVTYHNAEVEEEVEVENFKFTPMFEAKNGSYYTIKYQIYTLEQLDLANADYATVKAALDANADKALTKTYTLSNVTDTVAPTPQVVNAYEVETDGSVSETTQDVLDGEDVSYLIPSKARTQVEIEIPAIYATDNYNEYKDLTLSRTLIDEDGNTISLDGSEIKNESDDSTLPKVQQADKNQTAKVLFRLKGTYTVRYRATDKSNNTKDMSYKIVVTDTLEDNVAPAITLPTIVQNTKPGETITFDGAIVVDYKTDASSPEVIDERVNKNVYYYYGQADSSTDFDAVDKTELKMDEETSKYSLTVADNPTDSYITFLFRAEDDAKYATGNTENNVRWAYKVVRIFNVNDSVAPTLKDTNLSAIANALDGFGQGETLNIGEISFDDKDDNNVDTTQYLTSTLKVLDKNGNQIKVSGVKYTYDNSKFTMSNGKFVTTVAGTYQVIVTVTDLGGNSIVHSMQFEVEDTKAPVIEVENFDYSMELGKTYVLPTPVVVDDGAVVDNSALTLVEFGANNPSYKFNQGTMEFTPLEKGTYTFRFLGKDAADNDAASDWYTITAADTIKPVIVINETDEYIMPETAPYKDANNQVVNVNLPLFTATDEGEYNEASTSITVKNPDGDEIAVITEADHYEFTPTGNGIYTVTYKAVDLAENSTTQTYTIKVGDVVAPTISVDSKNMPSSYKIGDSISIDLSGLSTVDDVDGTTAGKDAIDAGRLTITLKNPDGTDVTFTKESDIWSYQFTTAGSYTLTYSATDKAGNTGDDVVYNFEVKATSNSSSVSEKTWGVVLIVVSVALLAGVVVYFVKTKDAPDAKDKKNKESK